jgi:outer membrane protein TolC
MAAAENALKQARWDSYLANFELLPTANLTGGYTAFTPEQQTLTGSLENRTSYGLNVNLPLFVGGKVWQNNRIKNSVYHIANHSYQNTRLTLISDIENKFFLVLEMKKNKEIADKEYENARTHEEISEIRHRNGTITSAELMRMRSLSVQRKVRAMQANTNYLTAMIDLKSTLSISDDIEPVDIPDDVFVQSAFDIASWDIAQIETFIENISDISLENNLTLVMSERNIDINRRAVTIAAGNFLPSVNLSFQKGWAKSNLEDDFVESGQLTLSASIPIFPVGNNVANYIKNRSNLRKVEYEAISLQNNINLALRSVTLAWISAIQSTEAARLSLEYAEVAWEQMNQRYINGVITATDMLDADIMLSNANFAFTNSRFNILRFKSNLKHLLNIENDEQFARLLSEYSR